MLQIVVLGAVFSLDAVITAVGMVDELSIMMIAVIFSIAIMLVASKPLTRFVNAHPTVIMLCLSFLIMIGFSLVANSLGFHIPKGYAGYFALSLGGDRELLETTPKATGLARAFERALVGCGDGNAT